MSKKPERLSHICKQNNQLHWLMSRTQQLRKLNIIFQKCLPLQFTQHCQLANIHNDSIVIHCDNASYASMIRFQANILCESLSAHLPHPVRQLDVKVRPLSTLASAAPLHSPVSLSNKTAALLNNTAADIEEGPLKTALEKLANRQTNLSKRQQDD